MKYLGIILFVLVLFTCASHEKKPIDKRALKETHDIVKALIDKETREVNSISKWTFPAYKCVVDTTKMTVPEFSSIKAVYSTSFLEVFVKEGVLSKEDASFMYSNIDSTLRYELDSTILNLNLVSDKKHKEIVNKQSEEAWWKYMFGEAHDKYFLNIGTPLFNKQYTKALVMVNKYINDSRSGDYYILEKKVNKWVVLYGETWWME